MTEWLLTDLHIHAMLSDGTLPIEEVVRIYGEAGFDAIAITDHLFDAQSPRSLKLDDEGKSVNGGVSIVGVLNTIKREFQFLGGK